MKGKEKKKISWWQWEKDETTNRTEKKQITGTVKKLIDYFVSVYKSFLIHSFINRQQRENFAEDLKYVNLHDDECLVQCDFAENWTNESQDEVSNAHWNQKQISLFTISLRYGCKQYSKVAVSDNLDHSKDTIFAYLYKTMSMVPKYINRIRLWTDGPSNQFKNKYMAATIKAFETKFHKKIIWNYHATAHGKSCVDGIGAVVKNKIKRLVNSRKSVVNCSRDFIDSFNQEPSNIELIEMSFADINKINKTMKLDTVTETAKTIKDISKFHQLQCVDNKIKGFVLSKDGYASLQ
ncbi:uncharacterized protein LOC119086005 [Bradysia coprophila]|uniref:uncharacterized protein LOC119086005 n=1 Tax=Bradysia coprophila TaxID=38358 RepID=UPI00187DA666|nr:uncharacterized protein LOC119086005 [Bradysia coprophila]